MEIVKVRVYRGELKKDEHGNWKTENHFVKIAKPSIEWTNFLLYAKKMYSKVELIEVTEESIEHEVKMVAGKEIPYQIHSYDAIEPSEDIKQAIEDIYKVKKVLTADQIKLQELEAKLKALTDKSGETVNVPVKKVIENKVDDSAMEALRDEYFALYEKKPSHLMKEETLIDKINEFKNNNKS